MECKRKSYYQDQDEDRRGDYTSLNYVDEFRCLIAALYGKRLDKAFIPIGGPDDPDIALRCAFYGNELLTEDQMRAYYERDDDNAFVFAALFNDDLYLKPSCRAVLEDISGGYLYVRRCEQIHKRLKRFNPRPISETGVKFVDSHMEKEPSEETMAIIRLDSRITSLEKSILNKAKDILWVCLIILLYVIFFNH